MNEWNMEDRNVVSFKLDKDHKFYIERLKNGFLLRMFDENEYNRKPILLYHKKISDVQLGHVGLDLRCE